MKIKLHLSSTTKHGNQQLGPPTDEPGQRNDRHVKPTDYEINMFFAVLCWKEYDGIDSVGILLYTKDSELLGFRQETRKTESDLLKSPTD